MKHLLWISITALLVAALPALGQVNQVNRLSVMPGIRLLNEHNEGLGRIAAYSITITGTCPGVMNLAWNGALPFRPQAILLATTTGNFVIPNNYACAGTPTGLGPNAQKVAALNTGPTGSGNKNYNVPPFACGRFVQLITVAVPCDMSNVWGPL